MKPFIDLKPHKNQIKAPFKIGDLLNPTQAMEVAIYEAYKGQGEVSPNPLVGCSILNSKGELLSTGYHEAYGQEHAEIQALKKILPSNSLSSPHHRLKKNFSPQEIHVFVTLEPCSFKGKTGSCAEVLSQLPISSLTYGLIDPHPEVSGRGLEILKSKLRKVEQISNPSLVTKIEELTEIFLYNMRFQKSFVALKIATSLDGQIALKKRKPDDGLDLSPSPSPSSSSSSTPPTYELLDEKRKTTKQKEWISNEKARKYGHFLRGCYDAILIGYGTLLADNPFLNIRHPLFPKKRNKVILIDPRGESLNFLHKTQMALFHPPEDIFVVIKESCLANLNLKNIKFQLIPCPEISVPLIQKSPFSLKSEIENPHLHKTTSDLKTDKNQKTLTLKNSSKKPTTKMKKKPDSSLELDLDFLTKKLYQLSITSVYVEGGAGVHSDFLRQGQVQRIFQFLSPVLLGAHSSQAWTKNLSISEMKNKIQLQGTKVAFFDDNILITGKTNFT